MDPRVELIESLKILLHPDQLITSLGAVGLWAIYAGLSVIIFVETGAMVFFLPGDSLLVTAGLFAANGQFSLALLNLLLIPCAIAGDATSYLIGKKAGPSLWNRPRSRFFRPEHVKAAHAFYEKHGGKAIIIARFMPLVRTFVPVIAGVAGMRYRDFAIFNIIGGAAWVISMTVLGYTLGLTFPSVVKHIELLIIVIVFLSILPGIIEYVSAKRRAAPV
jgi:membrane-associated protein